MFIKLHLNDFRIFKNQHINIGKTLTAIAGHNATGKSTILGILGNSCELKSKFGKTLTDKQFRTEFSEIFRGSKTYDKPSGTIGTLYFQFPELSENSTIKLRVTWQKWNSQSEEKNRFRIIPDWIDIETHSKTSRKLPVPSFYLGLSRLFPLGEDSKEVIEEKKFKNKLNTDEWHWLFTNYKHILSLDHNIESVSNFEINKKRSSGINTGEYDFLSNSSGQDNLMQILYLLLSFIKLKSTYDDNDDAWQGGILLIDEIDATLHPVAQIRLIELIYNTCKKYDFQAVFTTHSLQILKYLNKLQERNADINIEYFTTANDILQILHNPPYESMENDMMVSNYYLANQKHKIVIYSEDYEARWFIKKILAEYKTRFQLIDIKMGAESLMDLLKNDPDYFKNVLFILDGDKNLSTTKYKNLPYKYCNILTLPGETGPEEMLYNYLINLPSNHEILDTYFEKGLTLRTFQEMNPLENSKYRHLSESRDKYKQWFNDSLVMFDDIDIFNYWEDDNQELCNDFINNFINRYNIVASRTGTPKIN